MLGVPYSGLHETHPGGTTIGPYALHLQHPDLPLPFSTPGTQTYIHTYTHTHTHTHIHKGSGVEIWAYHDKALPYINNDIFYRGVWCRVPTTYRESV